MRQIHVTTKNLYYPTENDCFIDENDPIHSIKKASMLGGLGMQQALNTTNSKSSTANNSISDKIIINPRATASHRHKR